MWLTSRTNNAQVVPNINHSQLRSVWHGASFMLATLYMGNRRITIRTFIKILILCLQKVELPWLSRALMALFQVCRQTWSRGSNMRLAVQQHTIIFMYILYTIKLFTILLLIDYLGLFKVTPTGTMLTQSCSFSSLRFEKKKPSSDCVRYRAG